ncbi:MAG: hypothetical protein K0R17_927 [Rariglobus sp.]|jgi:beta-lactamase regulating signal transducer with metallopeptidase domain|nr:hypothetical protein [Rariglobus sp.]
MNLSSHLPLFVDLMLKSAVVLVLALLAARMWGRASAANRHMIWLAAFGALLVLPLTVTLLPDEGVRSVDAGAMLVLKVPAGPVMTGVLGLPPPVVAPASQPVAKRVWSVPVWRDGLVLVWLGGVAALLGWRMVGAVRLRLLRQRGALVCDTRIMEWCERIAADHKIRRTVELRVSDECHVAMTWGTLRPVVMLPVAAFAWTDERLGLVLHHELAHVRRGDCLARFFSQVACAFYWPNPLVWLAARRARLAQEQACDDRVLAAGVGAEAYAMELVAAVRDLNGRSWFGGAVAMAEPSTLESRVLGIVGEGRDRCALRGLTIAAASVCAALALVGCSQVTVRDEPKPAGTTERGESVEIRSWFVEFRDEEPGTKEAMAFLDGASRKGSDTAVVAGVLTEAQAAVAIKRLAGLHGADLLSTPAVSVRAGSPARIQVGQEFRYPTHWEKDPAGREWIASAFQTRNMGVEMEVVPRMNEDGSIDLDMNPQITGFEGFIEQEMRDVAPGKDNASNDEEKTEVSWPKVKMPLFRTHAVQAAVARLAPGQMVVLRCGTRMENVRDTTTTLQGKVSADQLSLRPVSLLVFVSAKIVSSTGEAIP